MLLQRCFRLLGKRSRSLIGQFTQPCHLQSVVSPEIFVRQEVAPWKDQFQFCSLDVSGLARCLSTNTDPSTHIEKTFNDPADEQQSTAGSLEEKTADDDDSEEKRIEAELMKLCHPDPVGFLKEHLHITANDATSTKPWTRISYRRKMFLQQYQKVLYPHRFDPPPGKWMKKMRDLLKKVKQNLKEKNNNNQQHPSFNVSSFSGSLLDPEEAFDLERISLLNAAHFSFDTITEQKWQRRYRDFARFIRQHGHTQVPVDNPKHYALHHWLGKQRARHKRQKLEPHRVALLEELDWNRRNARGYYNRERWEKKYNTLVEWYDQVWLARKDYEQLHVVLTSHRKTALQALKEDHPSVYKWLLQQRSRYRRGRNQAYPLSEECEKKLEMLPNELFDSKWRKR